MFFNRLNTNTDAPQNSVTVCYVHKKFGVIREEINTTKLKKQDGVTNQPKRFKVEALKSNTSDTDGPGKKAIITGTKTENNIKNKPLDMPDLSSPSLTSRESKPLQQHMPPLQQPIKGPFFTSVPPPLQQPLKEPFRPVLLPLQQPLKEHARRVLEKRLSKISDENLKFMCKINSEPNAIRHLTNTTMRSANKENLIKKPKEKYVESDSKESNAKETSNTRKINKETTPRFSTGVVKAKIESRSPTTAKGKQKKNATDSASLKLKASEQAPNKRKYNKRTIETQPNLEQAEQAPTLNSLKNKTECNMYRVKKINPQQYVVVSNKF